MFGTILVPLDGTAEAEAAVPYAAEEALRHGCPLVLVRVIPRPEPPPGHPSHGGPALQPPAWSPAELAQAQQDAQAYLESVVRKYGLPPTTELVVVIGDPLMRLLAEIQRRPSPLVVLGVAPHRPFGETGRRLLLSGAAPVLRVSAAPTSPTPAPAERAVPPFVAPMSPSATIESVL